MNEHDREQDDTALQRNVHHVYAHPADEDRFCAYCGAPLDGRYYFCPACATPYKSHALMTAHIKPVPLTPSERVWKLAPQAIAMFWNYAAVLVGLGVVYYIFFQEEDPLLVRIINTAALSTITCVYAVIHWKSLAVQFKRFGFNKPGAWIGLAILVPMLGINYVYHDWLRSLLGDVSESPPELGRATVFFFLCLSPAVLEEIALRGLVQHWLMTALKPWQAIALASTLFAALHFSHFNLFSFPYLFAAGVLLGWTKWKTGSLYPSILIHFLHNWVVFEYLHTLS